MVAIRCLRNESVLEIQLYAGITQYPTVPHEGKNLFGGVNQQERLHENEESSETTRWNLYKSRYDIVRTYWRQ